jgi:dihydrofolate reductase
MRKVILQEFLSIDGYAADPEEKVDFIQDYATRQDKSFQIDAERFLDTLDTMILGANTYKMFVEYWPEATEEGAFAQKLNSLSKFVVSTTIDTAPWGDWEGAEIIGNSTAKKITELKQKSGKDIVIWGSISLAQSLMQKGIIDEFQLRVCPTVLGSGKRLFAENIPMELLGTKTYDEGMVLLHYNSNLNK